MNKQEAVRQKLKGKKNVPQSLQALGFREEPEREAGLSRPRVCVSARGVRRRLPVGAGLQATASTDNRVVSRALPYPTSTRKALVELGARREGRPGRGHVLGPGALALPWGL